MKSVHIDDFYYTTSEVLCTLYAAFPRRRLLLVEDIAGPIKWDLTGLPDRKSQACFEALVWLSEHELLSFRTVEPRDVGVEGAVLTQKAFVLLTGIINWQDGTTISRIDALREARNTMAYNDLGIIVNDLFRANCLWQAPFAPAPLPKSEPLPSMSDDT